MGLFLGAAAGGLLLLPLLSSLPAPWLPAAAAGSLLALWLCWRQSWLLAACCFCTGFAWSVATAQRQLDLWIPAAWEEQAIVASGHVEGLPEPRSPQGLRFRFRPAQVTVGAAAPLTVSGRWQLFAMQADALEPGDNCTLVVKLRRPHGAANPGGFDYEGWLLSEEVTATGSVRKLSCRHSPQFSVDHLRLALRREFQRLFPERPASGVLLALLSGDRALVADPVWETYTATGIVHLMAISGLHVTVLGLAAFWLALQLLRRFPRLGLHCPLHKPALLAGFAVALAYSVFAGFTVPTQRTAVMLAAVVAAASLERRLPPFQVLAAALVATLLFSPLAVHAAGFWLSFGAVALLLLMGNAFRDLPAWRQGLQMQFAISLLLLPLTLWFFERASWVSPFANLLAVPLVTLCIVPVGLLGLLCWLAGLAGGSTMLWSLAIALIEILDALMEQFAAWPGASAAFSLPGWAGLLGLVLALVCLLQPLQKQLRLLAPLFLLPLLWPPTDLLAGQLRLTMLDVGQGLSVLVETPGHRLLYDTGPALGPQADAGSRYILPSLQRRGIYALDRLVLSHDDLDHTGGARSLLQGMTVGQGLGVAVAGATAAPVWQPCEAGQQWEWDGWRFVVLYPDAEQRRFARADNNRSCVLRISRGHSAVLLPGDLERLGELSLLDRFPADALKSTVLVLGHHGSRGASSEELLAAVRPQWALISAGYRNHFRHPNTQTLARLQQARTPWRNTAASGAVTVLLDAQGKIDVHEFRNEDGRYWQRRAPPAFSAD
jgi:competence protein ComEC